MLAALSACQDLSELEENPNKPATVPAALIFRGVLADLKEQPWSLEHRQNQYWACNYYYYGNNQYWTNASFNYFTLKNIVKMEEEAAKTKGTSNEYTAVGKFMRAYFYDRMAAKVGDLPMTEALQGLTNPEPVFDSQKEVYVQILQWLEEANDELAALAAEHVQIQGDIYYGGDLGKWQRAVNSFKLRMLIRLSKKENDADLGVKTKFAAVLSNPSKYPLFESNDDNMVFVYNGSTELYPTGPGNRGFDKGRYNMAQTYVKALTDRNDPRVFIACNPASKKLKPASQGGSDLEPTDFAAYVGAPSGESQDDMTFKTGNGEYSYANQKRYYTMLAGPEPAVQLSYWEQSFNIAEAINRGWVTGDAKVQYEKGVKASMDFYKIEDGTVLSITDSDTDEVLGTFTASVTNYLAQPSVSYAGNNATGLNQILTQKYIAFFQNSGLEAYYNFRRTGIPVFHAGPGTGNSDVIPRRWLYPTSDVTYNLTNYKASLVAQFGSEQDDVDNEIWINK